MAPNVQRYLDGVKSRTDPLGVLTPCAAASTIQRMMKTSRGGRRAHRRPWPGPAVDDVSFSTVPGKVTGLLGPSGCGKTTLMRAIVGVQIVESGTVTVLGEPAGSRVLRDRIGYVTQAPSVYDDLTVAENLRFFSGARRRGRRGRALRRGRRPRRPAGRRGGRDCPGAAVTRVAGGRPARRARALLVLDEPTVGLDPVLRRRDLWAMFHRLADQGHDGAGVQPRDGRGRAVRPADADARRPAARRRHPSGPARTDRHRRHRGRVPWPWWKESSDERHLAAPLAAARAAPGAGQQARAS